MSESSKDGTDQRRGMVTVYYFTKYDIVADKPVRSQRPATLEAIRKVRGEPILSTALEIEEIALDGNGFRRRESISSDRLAKRRSP